MRGLGVETATVPQSKESFGSASEEFRSPGYNKMVIYKWHCIRAVLLAGYEPFLFDVDVALLRNPLNFLLDAPKCDFTIAVDGYQEMFSPTANRFAGDGNAIWFNTGVLLVRDVSSNLQMIDEFLQGKYRIDGFDDQYQFNSYIQTVRSPTDFSVNGWECSRFRNGSSFHVLPPSLFASQMMVKQGFNDKVYNKPYAVHFNYLSGVVAKINEMKAWKLWLVEG
jgi:hypothetical protein